MPPKGITNTKAFKPPSRTASASTTTQKPNTANGKSRSNARVSRTSAPDTSLMDTFDNDTDEEGDQSNNEDSEEDAEASAAQLETPPRNAKSKNKGKASNSISTVQSIPADLLRTLLQHHFSDKKLKVGTEASLLVGKYLDTFVREALARAAFERTEADGGDFLEVEDLEKLAPQLLTDF